MGLTNLSKKTLLESKIAFHIPALRAEFCLKQALHAIESNQVRDAVLPLLIAKGILHDKLEVDLLLTKVCAQLGDEETAKSIYEHALFYHPDNPHLRALFGLSKFDPQIPQSPSPAPLLRNPEPGKSNHQNEVSTSLKLSALPQGGINDAPPVCVLIPVFEGRLATLSCIQSVLQFKFHNHTPHEIVVLDDHSPNGPLVRDLEALAQAGHIQYHRQPRNLGFIRNINQGMRLCSKKDVVWLNADTRVHGNWLDRLRSAAYCDPAVASATPLSNNGELMSFPKIQFKSAMPSPAAQAQLDLLLSMQNHPPIDIPIGCGFCLYIKRSALDAVGELDEISFHRGYGEETDWCLRAAQHGWRHVGVANLFVAHAGGLSFGPEKALRVKQNNEVIRRRYPKAEDQCERFRTADPLRAMKDHILRALVTTRMEPQLKHAEQTAKPLTINELMMLLEAAPVMIGDDLVDPTIGERWLDIAKACSRSHVAHPLLIIHDTPWEIALARTGAVIQLPRLHSVGLSQMLRLCGVSMAVRIAVPTANFASHSSEGIARAFWDESLAFLSWRSLAHDAALTPQMLSTPIQ